MKKKQLIVLFIFIGINLILLLLIYRINNYNRILIDELVQKKVDEKLTLSFFKENHELNNSDFLKMIKKIFYNYQSPIVLLLFLFRLRVVMLVVLIYLPL